MTLRLRRHHVLCCVGFRGEGYDDAFRANMSRLVYQQLRTPEGPDQEILITGNADAICAPCPHRVGLGCAEQAKIDRLDNDHGAALGIAAGDKLTWGECLDLVRQKIAPEDLDTICTGCVWLPMGLCKTAVARLKAGDAPPDAPKPE